MLIFSKIQGSPQGFILAWVLFLAVAGSEIIADNFRKPGGVGAVCQRLIPAGETIWIADAHREEGRRYIVQSDELLSAFLELEATLL